MTKTTNDYVTEYLRELSTLDVPWVITDRGMIRTWDRHCPLTAWAAARGFHVSPCHFVSAASHHCLNLDMPAAREIAAAADELSHSRRLELEHALFGEHP